MFCIHTHNLLVENIYHPKWIARVFGFDPNSFVKMVIISPFIIPLWRKKGFGESNVSYIHFVSKLFHPSMISLPLPILYLPTARLLQRFRITTICVWRHLASWAWHGNHRHQSESVNNEEYEPSLNSATKYVWNILYLVAKWVWR